ncbi:MAG TPA: hypothetical protein VIW80_08025 [Pyrinomonadaceae bacterium]
MSYRGLENFCGRLLIAAIVLSMTFGQTVAPAERTGPQPGRTNARDLR